MEIGGLVILEAEKDLREKEIANCGNGKKI